MTDPSGQTFIRSALVLSGGTFQADTVNAISEALLRLPHTSRHSDEHFEANVRLIAETAFTALFEHCIRHRGAIDLPLTGTPYAAMLLLASTLVAENEQMRESAVRNAQHGLDHELELLRKIEVLRTAAAGTNAVRNTPASEGPRAVAVSAWMDVQHRDDVGGQHRDGFCKACADGHRAAMELFSLVPDSIADGDSAEGDAVTVKPRLLVGHVSPETAFVVKSSDQARMKPRRDAHLMRFWVQTRETGRKTGLQRLMHQSTYRCQPGEWNPPQHGTYAPLVIMYLDEHGKFRDDNLFWRAQSPLSARAFRKSSLYSQLDDAQRVIFEQMCEKARAKHPEMWAKFEDGARTLAGCIRATGEEPKPGDEPWVSPDGSVTIEHGFAEHLERARELLQQTDATE